jgi:hypothetical protein
VAVDIDRRADCACGCVLRAAAWGKDQEDPEDGQLWEDNWEDDDVGDDFSTQLRQELEKGAKQQAAGKTAAAPCRVCSPLTSTHSPQAVSTTLFPCDVTTLERSTAPQRCCGVWGRMSAL